MEVRGHVCKARAHKCSNHRVDASKCITMGCFENTLEEEGKKKNYIWFYDGLRSTFSVCRPKLLLSVHCLGRDWGGGGGGEASRRIEPKKVNKQKQLVLVHMLKVIKQPLILTHMLKVI